MLSARLAGHVALKAQPNGEVAARFYGHSVVLGKQSARAHAAREALTRKLRSSSNDWPGMVFWNFGLDVRCAVRTR
jgi:hypothetical protein